MFRMQVFRVEEKPIHRHVWNAEEQTHTKTDEILRVEERTKVLFSGSEEAFAIWKRGHHMPDDAKIKKWRKQSSL